MEDGLIPKDLLCGKLATWARCRGHPQLHFKDVCKHNMKACNIRTESWEAFADNRTLWKQHHKDLKEGRLPSEKKMMKYWPGEQPVNSRTAQTYIRHLSSHARAVAENVNPGLAFTTTQGDVHQRPLKTLLHSR